jgi:site-specific recombinase XerD
VPLDIVPAGATSLPAVYDVEQQIKLLLDNSKARSTRRSYQSDIRQFAAWCEPRGLAWIPADPRTVLQHLAWAATEAGLSASSISRRCCAIAYSHKLARLPSPVRDEEVKELLAGIRRTVGVAPKPKTPATADIIARLLRECDQSLIGKRDRALIALGFAGALRRSELVALGVGDLESTEEGLRVTIRRSKTDQTGKGQTIPVPRGYKLKPVAAVQAWLAASGIVDGPLFRQVGKGGRLLGPMSGSAVAEVVKKLARKAGLDPILFSGHSLRSGFLTSAAEAGASVFRMQAVSRHKSLDTLSGYVRSADLFHDPAGASFL